MNEKYTFGFEVEESDEASDADAVMLGAEAGGGLAEEEGAAEEGVEAMEKELLTAAVTAALRAEV